MSVQGVRVYTFAGLQISALSHWGSQIEARTNARFEVVGWGVVPQVYVDDQPDSWDTPFEVRFVRCNPGTDGTFTPQRVHRDDPVSLTQGDLLETPTSIEDIERVYITPSMGAFYRTYPPGRRPWSTSTEGFGIHLGLSVTSLVRARGVLFWREVGTA